LLHFHTHTQYFYHIQLPTPFPYALPAIFYWKGLVLSSCPSFSF
jgi:hypothetical protein